MKSFASPNEPKIARYLEREFHPEDDALRAIRELAEREGLPQIQVGPMDGRHLETLCLAVGAKKAVEIGTLGGYSGTRLARAMSPQGKLYTLEIDSKHAAVARKAFELAKVSDRVEILLGPALESLAKLEKHGPFDLVFIDADKVSYPAYLKWAMDHVRLGGLILGDNTLAWGMIADDKFDDAEDEAAAKALRAFNHALANDPRFHATMLPTGEGLTVGVRVR